MTSINPTCGHQDALRETSFVCDRCAGPLLGFLEQKYICKPRAMFLSNIIHNTHFKNLSYIKVVYNI